MALRFWSSRMHKLSMARLPHLIPSCQLICNFSTVMSSLIASTPARDDANPAAVEDPIPVLVKKKERLSRQERTALVESFVLKHLEAHQGAFPSVTVVLKETGGGRNVVKDILSDLETQLVSRNSLQLSTDILSSGDVAIKRLEDENIGSGDSDLQDGKADPPAGEVFTGIESSESSSEDSNDSEDEGEVVDIKEEIKGGSEEEIEMENITLTNGQMIGPSQGEIETHSGLWSRLRGMGTSQSVAQGVKKQPRSQKSAHIAGHRKLRSARRAGSDLPSQDISESESTRENGAAKDFVALRYASTAEKDPQGSDQNGGCKEESGPWQSKESAEERHGLFVRYLSPQATPADMREAFADCGEIVRAQAIKSRMKSQYTYGFVDFKTFEALQKALEKEKVYIKGVRVQKEPSSSTRRTVGRSLSSNPWAVDPLPSRPAEQSTVSFLGTSKGDGIRGTGYSVAIEGVPMHVPLSKIQTTLSKYGEVLDVLQSEEGDCTTTVEFKTNQAREQALAAKMVQLNGIYYSISRADPVRTSVVRLSNVGSKVNEDQIGSMCERFGLVEKVTVRYDDSVDVYFQSMETENMPRILRRLNEVTMEGQQWQAQPISCIASGSYESLLHTRDGQEWLQLESERMLTKVESALKKLVVDVEDLQELVKAKKLTSPCRTM